MARMATISVTTETPEDWAQIFQDFSELARNVGATHDYVSVSTTDLDHSDEALSYDDTTLDRVREALWNVLRESSASQHIDDDLVTDMITEMQNAGILFRERPR